MIIVGMGANLPTKKYGPPQFGLMAAMNSMEEHGLSITKKSRLYSSPALVAPDTIDANQPSFLNCAVSIATDSEAMTLLRTLHDIERSFGRRRGKRWQARVMDLDLIAYDNAVRGHPWRPELPSNDIVLPHPEAHNRDFVLLPIIDLSPEWEHPATGETAAALLATIAQDSVTAAKAVEWPEIPASGLDV